jgi:hypothetical protein
MLSSVGCPVLLALLVAAAALHAQQESRCKETPRLPKSVNSSSAPTTFCHGARGGGPGPDLTRALKHHGNADAEIFHNIHDGMATRYAGAATASSRPCSPLQQPSRLLASLV